jgi:hypothetical protein
MNIIEDQFYSGRRGPGWQGAVGRGPWDGPARPGYCLQALCRVPASPYSSLEPITDQERTRGGLAQLDRKGSNRASPGPRRKKDNTSALMPGSPDL